MTRRGARTHAALAGLVVALILILPRPAHATPGDIDTTFATHGYRLLTFGAKYAQGNAVAIDGQGRIVAPVRMTRRAISS